MPPLGSHSFAQRDSVALTGKQRRLFSQLESETQTAPSAPRELRGTQDPVASPASEKPRNAHTLVPQVVPGAYGSQARRQMSLPASS